MINFNYVLDKFSEIQNKMKFNNAINPIVPTSVDKIKVNRIICYPAGQTDKNIPTKKSSCIGEGQNGRVYLHRNHHDHVVKKAHNLHRDFEIGNLVKGHPLFAETYNLFIKEYQNDQTKQKLEMEKIVGIELKRFCSDSSFKLNKRCTLSVLQSLGNGIHFLFNKNIVWADINSGNALITLEGQLKIIDYGFWEIENDISKKTEGILLGLMELLGWIVKSSFVRYQKIDLQKENNILFPQVIFKNRDILPNQIMTIKKKLYCEQPFIQDIHLCDLKTDEEMITFLMFYLDMVIDEIEKLNEPQYSFNGELVYYLEEKFSNPNDPNAIFTECIPCGCAEKLGFFNENFIEP